MITYVMLLSKYIEYQMKSLLHFFFFFFLNDPAPPEFSPLPHPAPLPICLPGDGRGAAVAAAPRRLRRLRGVRAGLPDGCDRSGAPRRAPGVSPRRLLQPVRRSEEHTSELQSPCNLVCRLLLEKKKTLMDSPGPTRRGASALIAARP